MRKKTLPVEYPALRDKLPAILNDMWDTCRSVRGAGLAASQIGLDLRLAVVSCVQREGVPPKEIVLINPVIETRSGRLLEEEGCLSLPGLYAKIRRSAKVKVRAMNEKGVSVEITAEGLLARALQHEIDHLDGILFIDNLPLLTRLSLRRPLARLKKQWAAMDESRPHINY